ncbi:MAG: YbaY family lipoprotein [Tahibacter sp.]
MNKLTVPVLVLALLLAACGDSNQNKNASTPAARAPMPTSVTGTVALKNPVPLSPNAQLTLKLSNVSSKPALVIAEKTSGGLTNLPVAFELPFDPSKIDQSAFHILDVTIVDGERHYVAPRQYPVVTKGATAKVDVQMTPEPTAGEQLEAEYALLQSAIGGMKRVQGASEEENSTTAWDGFFDKNGLRYIREITDYGDKGRSNFYFAYRDGKPMFVIKEGVPALAERPNSVTRAGWNALGQLVLHTRREGGSTGDLSEADAKSLYERAASQYTTISKRKP